jgi:hypothetical protein
MKGAALVMLAGLAACTDPAVEMTLVPAKTNATVDLSCVTAVDLLAIPNNDANTLDIGYRESNTQQRVPCVDLKTAPKSFADIQSQISGQFAMPLPPEGLAGVEIRGRVGTCAEMPAYHEAVFYGAAAYNPDNDELAIPVRYNLSCDQATTFSVKPIDLVSLVKTKTCAPTTSGLVFEGNIRPTLLAGAFAPNEFEAGNDFQQPDSTGTVMVTSYSSAFAGTCLAAAWEDEGNTAGAASCINPGAPAACGTGVVELPTVSYTYAGHAFDGVTAEGSGVIGAVWTNTGTKGPVAGATITPDEGAKATIIYGDVGTTAFQRLDAATTTNASGMFLLFANEVTGITVSAPGHPSRHVWVGGAPELPGTALVVL